MGDPAPNEPPRGDPPPAPPEPGEPTPEIEDPPAPGEPSKDPGIVVHGHFQPQIVFAEQPR